MSSPAYKATLGWGTESVYGTGVTPTHWAEFISESMRYDPQHITSPGIRGTRSRTWASRIPTRIAVGGDVAFDYWVESLTDLIRHALGDCQSSLVGPTKAHQHVITPADDLPVGFSLEVDKVAAWHKYTGCRVRQMTLTSRVGEGIRLTFALLGKDETVGSSGTSPTYISPDELLSFPQGGFKIGSTDFSIAEWSLTIDNMLKDDDYRIGSLGRFSADPRGRVVSGSFRLGYDAASKDAYAAFKAGTEAALHLTFTGTQIETTYYHSLKVDLPHIKYDGQTPNVTGADSDIDLTLPWTAGVVGTDKEVTVTVINEQAAA